MPALHRKLSLKRSSLTQPISQPICAIRLNLPMYQDDFSDIDALVERLQGPKPGNPARHVFARARPAPGARSVMPPGMQDDIAGFHKSLTRAAAVKAP